MSIDLIKRLIFRKFEFSEKTISQKQIYLLQSCGWNMGYSFVWDYNGPYSSELARDIDEYLNSEGLNHFISITAERALDSRAEDVIFQVRRLCDKFEEFPEYNFKKKTWCILIASIIYLFDNRKMWEIDNEDELTKTILNRMPKYSKEQCKIAIEEINSAFRRM